MSTVAVPKKVAQPEKVVEKVRLPIILNDQVRIPEWVVDLETFRRWARSDEFPERGWFSFLAGKLWVDLTMEQLMSHNQVKGEIAFTIMRINKDRSLGRFFHDKTLLSHPGVGLSTEPDGTFASWDAFRTDRIRLVKGAKEGYVELEGTPDMVLEVVSASSVQKDTAILRKLYWQAGIAEYWLVDARGASPRFDIFHRGAKGYVVTRRQGGWLKSAVFGQAFQFVRLADDPLGHPQYTLIVKP